MNKNSTLIVRKHRASHEGHSSHGAWKIAYADFMTALMAFFLMMWLTSATPENVRKGMANYFAPVGNATNITGTSSVLEGGESLQDIGNLEKMKFEQSILSPTTNYNSSSKKQESSTLLEESTPPSSSPEKTSSSSENMSGLKEQQVFEEAQKTLKEAIMKDPALQKMSDNILINIASEGLKIEIIDKNGANMFAVGGKKMLDGMTIVLRQVAKIIRILPNQINVTGHTDSRPYGANATYNNWDLSTDRALESRRFLVASGFPEQKIASVVGKASNELLIPQDPLSSSNRRISILVLRNTPFERQEKP
jgi:chemotaxis protein MotB